MALTEIRFLKSPSFEPEDFPADRARGQPSELAKAVAAYKDIFAAAGCALLAIASLLALPGTAANAWGLSYWLALLSFAGSGGCVVLVERRLRLGAQKPDTRTFLLLPLPHEKAPGRDQEIATGSDPDRRGEPPLQAEEIVVTVSPPDDSESKADSVQAEAAASETAALFSNPMQTLTERLGVEQARLTEALDLYAQSIQSRLNVSGVALAREFRDTGEHLSKRLETAGEAAAANIARHGETIIAAVGRSADEVDRRMIERSREALAQINAAVAKTAQSVAGMSETAAAGFARVLQGVSECAAAGLKAQIADSESQQRNLAKIAQDSGETLSRQATKAADAIENRLQGAASSLERMVDAALRRIESRIDGRIDELSERLVGVEKELDRNWATRREGLAAEFAAAAAQTRAAMADAAAEVGRAANEAVTSAKQNLASSLQASLQQWLEAAETSAQQMGSRGERLRDQIVARQAELIEVIERGVAKTETGLSESLTATAATMGALVTQFNEDIQQRGVSIAHGMLQASGLVLDTLADRMNEAREVFATASVEAEKAIDLGRERLVTALAATARAGAEGLSARGLQSQRALEDEGAKAVERIEAIRAALADAAAQSADRFAGRLSDQAAELQRAMAQGTERLRREFAAPLADTLARIETEGVELAGATRVLAETLASTSSTHRAQLQQAFAREADALAATVAANAEAFRRDFEAVVAGADSVYVSRGLDLARTLAARVAEMRALLEGEGVPLLQALDARSGDLSQQIEAASQRSISDFERKAAGLIGLLTRRGDDLLSAMTAAASESARKVVALKSDVDSSAALTEASLRDIERKAGVILDLIDRRAASLSQGAA